jgi:uncharacterized protein (DUF1015 family)
MPDVSTDPGLALQPFRAVRYDPARVRSLAAVTSPPYDVIDEDALARFLAEEPHNVVRLILGRDKPGDDHLSNKYTRAADLLRAWRDEGALRTTPHPSWFLYEMRFTFQGRPRRIRGVLVEVEIEALGGSIVPHERTLPGPVDDRMRLLRAVRANLSAVYALYRGPQPSVDAAFEEAAARAAGLSRVDAVRCRPGAVGRHDDAARRRHDGGSSGPADPSGPPPRKRPDGGQSGQGPGGGAGHRGR